MGAVIRPAAWPFRVPSAYQDPPRAAWEAIRQRDLWLEDRRTPAGYIPTPSELWREPGGIRVLPLGNIANTATPPLLELVREARQEREQLEASRQLQEVRTVRYGLRATAQLLSKRGRVSRCGRGRGRTAFGGESAVSVMVGHHGRAHYTGLEHCGSVWECAVCMQRISSARADEIRALVTRHRAAGGSVYLLTLTLPHDEGDDLRQLRKCVARAWSKVQSGNVFQRWKKRIGIVGTVRALEVNHGPNGWHPHIHVLVLTAGKLEDTKGGMSKDAKNFETMVFRRWGSYITERDKKTKRAYRFPSREHGISFKQSHKDTYIAKMGLADELARGAWKSPRSRDGYRTPLQILRDVERRAENGVHPKGRDAKLWTEYADNMHGARQLTWSRGLRKLYDLGEEQTDLELAETEPEAIQVYEFKPEIWDNYLKNDHAAQLRVLFGAEVGGWDGVQREIDRLRGRMPVPF